MHKKNIQIFAVCQYCRFYKLNLGTGWCFGPKGNWTARKDTCKDFERKKK